jgi:hypothetical protein
MLIFPTPKYRKPRGRQKIVAAAPAPPAALTMIEASFDPADGVYLRLTFDRPIDASGLNGAAITQGVEEFEYLYNATGGYTMIDPATIEFLMVHIGSSPFGDYMHATGASGIVAVDDGGTWAGVPDTGLPFP